MSSFRTVRNLFYSPSQNVKEEYVMNVFKLKALVLHSELCQQQLRERKPLHPIERKAPVPTKSFISTE